MANVKIHCPNCQQEYDVDEADLGREAECEACKKTFVLQADEPLEPPRRKTKTTVSVEKKDIIEAHEMRDVRWFGSCQAGRPVRLPALRGEIFR